MGSSVRRSLAFVAFACLVALVLLGVAATATAQALPRSFTASPDIYKVIAQNEQYKVIEVVWKPGQRDLLHSHPASAVYYLTDCSLRVHRQDGTVMEAKPKGGAAVVQQPIAGHILENIGAADCKLIMFEPA
jgi:beta-alanine degradation protein BauB